MLTVSIPDLLNFYDSDINARSHSNAIKTVAGEELGFALLLHYLQSRGQNAEILRNPATTKGNWLDGWVLVKSATPIYYQVEVKSWSMHSYGGGKQIVEEGISKEELSAYKVKVWDFYWENGKFKDSKLNKVLKPMKPPVEGVKVEPLACLWSAVHDKGLSDPFFSVQTVDCAVFPKVHVFSMSAHLRNLLASGTKKLTLDLRDIETRLSHLNLLFGRNPSGA